MQKSVFLKAALAVITVTLAVFCLCCLQKAGIQPLWAAVAILFFRGLIRFIFRLTVILLSVAITVWLFISLLTCI
jgi:hypothetical protein